MTVVPKSTHRRLAGSIHRRDPPIGKHNDSTKGGRDNGDGHKNNNGQDNNNGQGNVPPPNPNPQPIPLAPTQVQAPPPATTDNSVPPPPAFPPPPPPPPPPTTSSPSITPLPSFSTSSSSSTSSSPSTSSRSSTDSTTPLNLKTTPTILPVQQPLTSTEPPQTAISSFTNTGSDFSSSTDTSAIVIPSNASDVSNPSNKLSAGPIAGGVLAAIAAITAIVFAIVFYVRRSRNRRRSLFDAPFFRRSAMLLEDPPNHDYTVAHGFNPPPVPPIPPNMMERQLDVPTFGPIYGNSGSAENSAEDSQNAYDVSQEAAAAYRTFAPGQVVSITQASPIAAASSVYPIYPSGFTQSPFNSPSEEGPEFDNMTLSSTHPSNHPSNAATEGEHAPPPNLLAFPVLTRQGSSHSTNSQRSMGRDSVPLNDYVDLNRSSVSPFQAAQYEAISKRLKTDVPQGLQDEIADRPLPPLPPSPEEDEGSPFADPRVPFADQHLPPTPSSGQFAIVRRNLMLEPTSLRPMSGDSAEDATLEFPIPPSPAHTVSSRYRVDSLSSLPHPEFPADSRSSIESYPNLKRDSGSMGSSNPNLTFRFPSSRTQATPDAENITHAPPTGPPKVRSSLHNMYTAEDAYEGV